MSSKRVLVVDDEPLARISLADYLEEVGYKTISAGDGESAIELQREQLCDVCIVDIRLPGIDGIDTILALSKITPDAQFIVYTGSPQFSLSAALQDLGLSERDVVRKPVMDMEVFLTLIESGGGGQPNE